MLTPMKNKNITDQSLERRRGNNQSYADKVLKYSSSTINKWKKKSYDNLRVKNPIKHKALRLRMSLTTFKVKNGLTTNQIYDKILRPQTCPYCIKSMDFLEITWDHKTARSDNGSNEMSNLQFCCLRCNQLKGGLNDLEFRCLLEVFKIYPDLIAIYEKRIKPSLAYFRMMSRVC